MEENLGGRTFVREMSFASEDGVRVSVRIESPRDGMRSAAIRSAMVNTCHLYPLDRPAKPSRDTHYGVMALIGLSVVVLAYALILAMVASAGMTQERLLNDPVQFAILFKVMPAFFIPFCVGFFMLMEFQGRRFRRKSEALSHRFAA